MRAAEENQEEEERNRQSTVYQGRRSQDADQEAEEAELGQPEVRSSSFDHRQRGGRICARNRA